MNEDKKIDFKKQFLKIGFIRKPHGLKGELKLLPLTDNPERFKKLTNIFFMIKDKIEKHEIDYVKVNHQNLIIKLTDCNSIEKAEQFRSQYLFINRENGETLNEWEYYSQDLVDCRVFFKSQYLGLVIDLTNAGANDNLVIVTEENKEILYPFLRDYIDKIDIDRQSIEINQYEGFFD